jgi:hypothetical protein
MTSASILSAIELLRQIAVGPRRSQDATTLFILPIEVLRLICTVLVRQCLIDCMLNPYMFVQPPDPEVTNYLMPTLLSLAHSCKKLRKIVMDILADALDIKLLPDGRYVTLSMSNI